MRPSLLTEDDSVDWSPCGTRQDPGFLAQPGGGGLGFSSLRRQHIPKMVLNCLNKSYFLLISITISKVKNVFLKMLIEMQQRILMREMVSCGSTLCIAIPVSCC